MLRQAQLFSSSDNVIQAEDLGHQGWARTWKWACYFHACVVYLSTWYQPHFAGTHNTGNGEILVPVCSIKQLQPQLHRPCCFLSQHISVEAPWAASLTEVMDVHLWLMTVIFSLQLRQKSSPQKAKWAQRDKFFCILSAVLFCFPLVWALWNSSNLIFHIYFHLSLFFCCGLYLIPSYVLKRFVSALNNLKKFAGVRRDRTNTREILGGFLQGQTDSGRPMTLKQSEDGRLLRMSTHIFVLYFAVCSCTRPCGPLIQLHIYILLEALTLHVSLDKIDMSDARGWNQMFNGRNLEFLWISKINGSVWKQFGYKN